MYCGLRDNHLTDFVVPQYLCERFVTKDGKELVEIALPGARDTSWDSWVVQPEQVYYKFDAPDELNVIEGINRDTDIVVVRKFIDARTGMRRTDPNHDYIIKPEELMKIYNQEIINMNRRINFNNNNVQVAKDDFGNIRITMDINLN